MVFNSSKLGSECQPFVRVHDAWLRAEIEKGVREAENPAIHRTPHDEVATKWRRRRAVLATQAGDPRV